MFVYEISGFVFESRCSQQQIGGLLGNNVKSLKKSEGNICGGSKPSKLL